MNFFLSLIPKKYFVPLKFYYYYFRLFLEPEIKLLSRFVKKNDTVIDVGGNWGSYSYYFSLLKVKLKIFEPNIYCFNILNSWAKNKKSVTVFNKALSNKEGKVYLNIPFDKNTLHHASGSISSSENKNFPTKLSIIKQKVKKKKLDSYNFKNVNFIKIDVEGHELEVIKGSIKTILKFSPTLLIEIEQRHHKRKNIKFIFKKILDFGYDGFFYKDKKFISINEFDIKKHQQLKNLGKKNNYINNFFFIKKK